MRLRTMWRIVWSDHAEEYEVCREAEDEVIGYLKNLHTRQTTLRTVVEVLSPDSGPWMSIALGADETVLLFDASDKPPCFVSVGDTGREGESPIFCHGMQGVEYLARSMISISTGFAAIEEFLKSSSRPQNIVWEIF